MRSGEKVLFVATAEARDDEMRRRIEAHKAGRPASWTTLETPTDIGNNIREHAGGNRIILLDCITLLVNAVFNQFGENLDEKTIEEAVVKEIDELIECMNNPEKDFIIVTNEVGLGLVPANEAGRFYRDILGKANSMLAAACDEVYLMVSGLPVKVKPSSQ
jgi:adenosylcobinamide kinase/adenosylcobinamide-phosphate guanylyltransferase